MNDPASDFLKNFQTRVNASVEEWMGKSHRFTDGPAEFVRQSAAPGSADALVARSLAALKGYSDWLQGAGAHVSDPQGDWREQMQQLFGGASQPFSQGFAGVDNANAKVLADQWQAWLQAMRKDGGSSARSQTPFSSGFGFGDEHQAQQQDLAAAISRHLEATQRYQLLIQRSNAQAMEKMQARLAQLAKPGQQIESLKVLYDLWVDCAEEAYAEIALSDEFRETYSEMVNTQIRVRQLQQEQTEYICQQLGIPTRSDLSSLGERLQAMRREMRNSKTTAPEAHAPDAVAEELTALRREVAELRNQLLAGQALRSASRKKPAGKAAAKPLRSAVKKAATKVPFVKKEKIPAKKSATVSISRTRPVAGNGTRKRK